MSENLNSNRPSMLSLPQTVTFPPAGELLRISLREWPTPYPETQPEH